MGWRSLSHKETDLKQDGSGFKTESPPRSSPPNTITWGIWFQPVKIQEHKHSDHNMTLHAQRYASFIFLFLKFSFRASLFPSQYLACWETAEKEDLHLTLKHSKSRNDRESYCLVEKFCGSRSTVDSHWVFRWRWLRNIGNMWQSPGRCSWICQAKDWMLRAGHGFYSFPRVEAEARSTSASSSSLRRWTFACGHQGQGGTPTPSLFSVPSSQQTCLILCVSPISDPGQGELMPTRVALVESERLERGSHKPGVVSKH